jgi:hypothetical protein
VGDLLTGPRLPYTTAGMPCSGGHLSSVTGRNNSHLCGGSRLSHEVSEWLHDPFISNTVPPWESPLPLSSGFYGCSSLLETGDAVSDAAFEVNGYQLQDEAFLSWFAHQAPSIGIGGQYSYLGTFTQPSPLC